MNPRLPDHLEEKYRSPSQRARVLTEYWTAQNAFCPSCQLGLTQAATNAPALDFYCSTCLLAFELKSKKGRFGQKVVDGAYKVMMDQILGSTHPNLLLLAYTVDGWVKNFLLVPKRFLVPELVEKRKPLNLTARRAGWTGCNIQIGLIPADGQIYYVREGTTIDKETISHQWEKTRFLDTLDVSSRSWLVSVMSCVRSINKPVFSLEDVYKFVPELQKLYPNNRHIKAKVRQQMQVLRDKDWLAFLGRGVYRLNP